MMTISTDFGQPAIVVAPPAQCNTEEQSCDGNPVSIMVIILVISMMILVIILVTILVITLVITLVIMVITLVIVLVIVVFKVEHHLYTTLQFFHHQHNKSLPPPQRRMDGRCNHLTFPLEGSSGQPYARLLPPQYGPEGTPRCFYSFAQYI